MKVIHKYGRNPAVAGSWESIWEAGGEIPWSSYTAAETISVVSSGANAADDDGAPPGTGARTVTLQGLDADYNEISETVTMNGTTPAVTSAEFWRVYRMWVATVGSAGTNRGTIIATGSDSSAEHNRISIDNTKGLGQSQYGAYTLPAGYGRWGLHSAVITVEAAQAATVGLFAREPGGAARLKLLFDGVKGPLSYTPHSQNPMAGWPAGTDLWWAGYASTSAAVSVDFELIAPDFATPYTAYSTIFYPIP